MNTSIIKAVPSGNFEEISIHMPEWEAKFLHLVEREKHIKYSLYTMPNIPENVLDELSKRSFCLLILEEDNWQHFLVPKSN